MLTAVHCIMAILAMLHQPGHTSHAAPPRANRGVQRTNLDWAALRRCESGGNYANRNNPRYRGAYQFSFRTWATVGGTGDPAEASPDEQDQRAALLFQRSGRGQWPTCGRLL